MRDTLARWAKRSAFLRKLVAFQRSLPRRLRGRIRAVRLRVTEWFIPRGFFIQIQSRYADARPGITTEQARYDALHDWPDMRDGVRVVQTRMLLEQAARCASGEYAELGTFRGNLARLIYDHKVPGSRLYCFDTFEGFDERDVRTEREKSGIGVSAGSFSTTTLDLVVRTIKGNRDGDDLVLRKGYFPETFAGLENLKWRFVVLDADLYEPTRSGLEAFWPAIVPGGVLLIDDCTDSYYRGVGLAVTEFFQPLGVHPMPFADRSGGVAVIKPGVIGS